MYFAPFGSPFRGHERLHLREPLPIAHLDLPVLPLRPGEHVPRRLLLLAVRLQVAQAEGEEGDEAVVVRGAGGGAARYYRGMVGAVPALKLGGKGGEKGAKKLPAVDGDVPVAEEDLEVGDPCKFDYVAHRCQGLVD